jgi:LmeA-like phospholipid-binding
MSTAYSPRGRFASVRAALRRHLILTIAAAVVLTMALAAGIGELVAGNMIQDRIAHAAPSLGSDLSVSESGSALWDVMHKDIPQLQISSDDATFGPLSGATVQAQLNDVQLGGQAKVASSTAEVTVPTQSIASAVQAKVSQTQVSSVTMDPASGTILVALGPGGVGQLTLKPELGNGQVSLSATGLTVMGRSLPLSALGGSGLGQAQGADKAYPLGLKATSLTVQSDGLHVSLSGGSSTLAGS